MASQNVENVQPPPIYETNYGSPPGSGYQSPGYPNQGPGYPDQGPGYQYPGNQSPVYQSPVYQGPGQVSQHPSAMVAVQMTPSFMYGRCPNCQVGVLHEGFSPMGIACCVIWGILLLPTLLGALLGLICLFGMRERICTSCGARFEM